MKLISAVLAIVMSIPTMIQSYPTHSDSSIVAMNEIKKKKKKKERRLGRKERKRRRDFLKIKRC